LAKEGIGIVVGLLLLAATLFLGFIATENAILKISAIVFFSAALFSIYFFRDPVRTSPDIVGAVVSPADGKVVSIVKEHDIHIVKGPVTRVSIFLSVFNVHVNRIPISGKINFFRYKKGAFINAYKKDASEVNEQTIIGLESDGNKIVFKQIAGLIARRIVCHVREGNVVTRGEKFGIIKFGSRMDILLPENVEVKVNVNDRVKGGESVIGVFV